MSIYISGGGGKVHISHLLKRHSVFEQLGPNSRFVTEARMEMSTSLKPSFSPISTLLSSSGVDKFYYPYQASVEMQILPFFVGITLFKVAESEVPPSVLISLVGIISA